MNMNERRSIPTSEFLRSNPVPQFNFLCFCFSVSWLAIPVADAAPRHVYLTWQGDTSTTMTVNYQTMEAADASMVYYDTKPRKEKIGDYRFHAAGTRHKIDGL